MDWFSLHKLLSSVRIYSFYLLFFTLLVHFQRAQGACTFSQTVSYSHAYSDITTPSPYLYIIKGADITYTSTYSVGGGSCPTSRSLSASGVDVRDTSPNPDRFEAPGDVCIGEQSITFGRAPTNFFQANSLGLTYTYQANTNTLCSRTTSPVATCSWQFHSCQCMGATPACSTCADGYPPNTSPFNGNNPYIYEIPSCSTISDYKASTAPATAISAIPTFGGTQYCLAAHTITPPAPTLDSYSVTYSFTVPTSPALTGTFVTDVGMRCRTASPLWTGGLDYPAGTAFSTSTANVLSTNIKITKTVSPSTASAGSSVTFTITAQNSGATAIPLPKTGTAYLWSLIDDWSGPTFTGGAYSWQTTSTSTGGFVTSLNLVPSASIGIPAGSSYTLKVTAVINPSATAGTVSFSASAPRLFIWDSDSTDNAATTTLTVTRVATLTPLQTLTTTGPYDVASTITYSITLGSSGPSYGENLVVTDSIPTQLTSTGWECIVGSSASCAATTSAAGNLAQTDDDIAPGGSLIYLITGTILPSVTAGFTNTFSAGTPAVSTVLSIPTSNIRHVVDISITKVASTTTVAAGASVTFSITVSNSGPGTALVSVEDSFPTSIYQAFSFTSPGPLVAGVGTLTGSVSPMKTSLNIPPGTDKIITVTAQVSSSVVPAATSNVATANIMTYGTAYPGLPLVEDSDGTTFFSSISLTVGNVIDLTVSKQLVSTLPLTPGSSVTFSIGISNAGPGVATAVSVTDYWSPSVPLLFSSSSCTGSGCPPSAPTALSFTNYVLNDLAAGANVELFFTGVLQSSVSIGFDNTVSVNTLSSDGNLLGDSSSSFLVPTSQIRIVSDVVVSKTVSPGPYYAGTSVTYSITVENTAAAQSDVGVLFTDDWEPLFLSGAWTCTGSGGSLCNGVATTSGSISFSAYSLTVPRATTVSVSLVAKIDPSATANIVNSASVSIPFAPSQTLVDSNSRTSMTSITLSKLAALTITKTANPGSFLAGSADRITFTIIVSNGGPSTVTAPIVDNWTRDFLFGEWSCAVPPPGSSCPPSPGATDIGGSVTVAPGSPVTILITASIYSSVSASTTLTNIASVSSPFDPTPAHTTSTQVFIESRPNLSVTKTVTPSTAIAGDFVTYSITVSNLPGFSDSALPVYLTDNWMSGNLVAGSWNCNPSSICSQPLGVNTDISVWSSVPLISGSSYTVTLTASINPSSAYSVTTTASITTSSTVDSTTTDWVTSLTVGVSRQVDLSITKSVDIGTSVVPGQSSLSYSIVISNQGPSYAEAISVNDVIINLDSVQWTCTPSCPGGINSITTSVNIPPGNEVYFDVTGKVPSSVTMAWSNTVSVSVSSGTTNTGDTSDTVTIANSDISPSTQVSITKISSTTTPISGDEVTFSIVISNNAGPSDAYVSVVDDWSPTFENPSGGPNFWDCSPSCVIPAGPGDIATAVPIPVGTSVSISLTTKVSSTASNPLSNVASFTRLANPTQTLGPNIGTTISSVTLNPFLQSIITVDKTYSPNPVIPGDTTQPITYSIVIKNDGLSTVSTPSFTDIWMAGLQGGAWVCSPSSGSTCAASSSTTNIINQQFTIAPNGGSVVYKITGSVHSSVVSLSNEASVSAPTNFGSTESTAEFDTATVTLSIRTDIQVTKIASHTARFAGEAISYTIVLKNNGPSDVVAPVSITDNWQSFGTFLTGEWGCSSCTPPSGTDTPIDTRVSLVAGSSVSVSLTAQISPSSLDASIGNIVSSSITGSSDPLNSNDLAASTIAVTRRASLSVSKTLVTPLPLVPGESGIVYSITISNQGPSFADAVSVVDSWTGLVDPQSPTAWNCVPLGPAFCGTPNGAGDITNVQIQLAPASTVTFTLSGTLRSSASSALSNIVSIATPAGLTNPGETASAITVAVANIYLKTGVSITKVASAPPYVAGLDHSYTITLSNAGPSDATLYLQDLWMSNYDIPADPWTCSPSCSVPVGSSATNLQTSVSLPASSSATAVLPVKIYSTAVVGASILNSASFTLFDVGQSASDSIGVFNTATGMGPVIERGQVSVTKSLTPTTIIPGTTDVTYCIRLTNSGPSTVDTTISDIWTTGLQTVSWSCSASSGSNCNGASGSGDISGKIPFLGPSGSVEYVLVGKVRSTATAVANTVSVTATANQNAVPALSTVLYATTSGGISLVSDFAITKTRYSATALAGNQVTFSMLVSNLGPSAASTTTPISVTDHYVGGPFIGGYWFCSGCVETGGTGDIDVTLFLAVGATASIGLVASIDASTSITSYTNQASITWSNPNSDIVSGNNLAYATLTTISRQSDLVVSKSITPSGSVVPGDTVVTYSISIINNGPSYANLVSVTDAWTGFVDPTGSWTCTAVSGSNCLSTGSGDLANAMIDIAPSGSLTFHLTGTVRSSVSTSVSNAVSLTVNPLIATTGTPISTISNIPISLVSEIEIQKGTLTGVPVAGLDYTFSIRVTNQGPSDIVGLSVIDNWSTLFDSDGSPPDWFCAPAASCSLPSGAGDISVSLNLVASTSASLELRVKIRSSSTAAISNTASVVIPSGVSDPGVFPDFDVFTSSTSSDSDFAITKTNLLSTVVPGATEIYSIVVTNNGPSDADFQVVDYQSYPGGSGSTYQCVAGPCPSASIISTSQPVIITGFLSALQSLTYKLALTVDSAVLGTLTNTASVDISGFTSNDTIRGNNQDTETDTLSPVADLSISKDDGVTSVAPGGSVTYSIIVTNKGPSDSPLLVASVQDLFSSSSYDYLVWECFPGVGSSCYFNGPMTGTVNERPTLLVGSSVQIVVTARVRASVPAGSSTLINRASVGLLNGYPYTPAWTDPIASNDVSTDSDSVVISANIAVSLTAPSSAQVGGVLLYSLLVENLGPGDVSSVTVTEYMPGTVSFSWDCYPSPSASCLEGSILGNTITTTSSIPGGGSVLYVISSNLLSTLTSGDITSTASVTSGFDSVPSDDFTQTTVTLFQSVDLSLAKTNYVTLSISGTSTTYDLTVTNLGPSDASTVRVVDFFPDGSGLTYSNDNCAFPCVRPGAFLPPLLAYDVPLNVGENFTITVTVKIDGSVLSSINNTVSASAVGATDPDSSNTFATDIDTITTGSELSISNSISSVVPGTPVTYSITIINNGPSDTSQVSVVDQFPAVMEDIVVTSCTQPPTSLPSCSASAYGVTLGLFTATPGLTLSSPSVQYIFTANLHSSATGLLTNEASLEVSGSTLDSESNNNFATNITMMAPNAAISLVKSGPTNGVIGSYLTYTIQVRNAGPSDALSQVSVIDLFSSSQIVSVDWACASGTANVDGIAPSCPPTGSGLSLQDPVYLPFATSIQYIATARVSSSLTTGTLVTNTASASLLYDSVMSNNYGVVTTSLSRSAVVNTTGSSTPPPPPPRRSRLRSRALPSGYDGYYTPGMTQTYTLVVVNYGPSDTFTGEIQVDSNIASEATVVSWSCYTTGLSYCDGAQTNVTGTTPTFSFLPALVANTQAVIEIIVSFAPEIGSSNVSVGITVNIISTDLGGPSQSGDAIISLRQQRTDLRTTAVASPYPDAVYGSWVYFTVNIINDGPSVARDWDGNYLGGIQIDNSIPSIWDANWDLASVQYLCSVITDATCPSTVVTVSSTILPPVRLGVSGEVQYSVSARLNPLQSTPDPTSQVSFYGSPNPDSIGTITQADLDFNLGILANITVSKTDGLIQASPGSVVTYTIEVVNSGPSAATQLSVKDTWPTGLIDISWGCSYVTSGTGGVPTCIAGFINSNVDIDDLLDVPPQTTVTYIATVGYGPIIDVNNVITNNVDVELTSNYLNTIKLFTATDTTTVGGFIDIAIASFSPIGLPPSNSFGPSVGQSVFYQLVVQNNGPVKLNSATLRASFPVDTIATIDWSCNTTAFATCNGQVAQELVSTGITISPGQVLGFNIRLELYPSVRSGIYIVSGSIELTEPEIIDNLLTNNVLTNSDLLITPVVDVSITMVDSYVGPDPIEIGDDIFYSITICNMFIQSWSTPIFTDRLPAVLDSAQTSWNCTSEGSAACSAPTGRGSLIVNRLTLPNTATLGTCGDSVLIVIQTVLACKNNIEPGGLLTNLVFFQAPGETDTDPSNDQAQTSHPMQANVPPTIYLDSQTYTAVPNSVTIFNTQSNDTGADTRTNQGQFTFSTTSNGVIRFDDANIPGTVTLENNGSNNVTLTGPNLFLNAITTDGFSYTSTLNETGLVVVDITFNDLGAGGCDQYLSATTSIEINFVPTCVAPTPVECDNGQCRETTAQCCAFIICSVSGLCVPDISFCCNDPNRPIRCSDGSCVSNINLCTACPSDTPIRCTDGTCQESSSNCCPEGLNVRCSNGQCVVNEDNCGSSCASGLIKCTNGDCVTSQSLCPDSSSCPSSDQFCFSLNKCIPKSETCPEGSGPTVIGDNSIDFDQGSLNVGLGGSDVAINITTGTIEELDRSRNVVQAEDTRNPDLVYKTVRVTYEDDSGQNVINFNFTTTLTNGAILKISSFIFSGPTETENAGNKLATTGGTTKLGISIFDWPFYKTENTLKIEMEFDVGGTVVDDPCAGEDDIGSGDLRVSVTVETESGALLQVSVLQYATIDGKKRDVVASLNETNIIIETPSFKSSMEYDPDFSILLGGTSGGSDCLNPDRDALLYASVSVLATCFGLVGLFIVFVVTKDIHKKRAKRMARAKAEQAYSSAMRGQGAGSNSGGSTWGSSTGSTASPL